MSECRTVEGKPKWRFDSRSEAKAILRLEPAKYLNCHPYRCGVCGWFHLGHYPSEVEARRGLRRRWRAS